MSFASGSALFDGQIEQVAVKALGAIAPTAQANNSNAADD